MKVLLLILILCTLSCSSTQKFQTYSYECGIFGRHGLLVKTKGNYSSEAEAQKDTEKVRDNLVKLKVIAEETIVMCFKSRER